MLLCLFTQMTEELHLDKVMSSLTHERITVRPLLWQEGQALWFECSVKPVAVSGEKRNHRTRSQRDSVTVLIIEETSGETVGAMATGLLKDTAWGGGWRSCSNTTSYDFFVDDINMFFSSYSSGRLSHTAGLAFKYR